jgi:hypothetical protein
VDLLRELKVVRNIIKHNVKSGDKEQKRIEKMKNGLL